MKTINVIYVILLGLLFASCSSVKPATISKNDDIKKYKYFYISPTNSLTSSSGTTINGQYYSSTKSVNPSDIITGILTKEGFIKIPELNNELKDQTLIINYGESGRRGTGLGSYAIEVTIQFITANTHTSISSCTAEGRGETEADDIRKAIKSCLGAIFQNK